MESVVVVILGPTVLTPLFFLSSRSIFVQVGNAFTLLGGGAALLMYVATSYLGYALGSATACCIGIAFYLSAFNHEQRCGTYLENRESPGQVLPEIDEFRSMRL